MTLCQNFSTVAFAFLESSSSKVLGVESLRDGLSPHNCNTTKLFNVLDFHVLDSHTEGHLTE